MMEARERCWDEREIPHRALMYIFKEAIERRERKNGKMHAKDDGRDAYTFL